MYRGWVNALRGYGIQVAEFNLDERLSFYSEARLVRDGELVRACNNEAAVTMAAKGIEVACYEWWPDVVIVVSSFFVSPFLLDVMRDRGHRVVVIHTESPYEDDRQLRLAPHADLNVLNDPTNIGLFAERAPTVYIPHAYDPALHRPRPVVPRLRSDFAFVGTGFQSRVEFFEKVDFGGLHVVLGGNWNRLDPDSPLRGYVAHNIDECCPNDETARIYASTKTSANLYRKEASHSADGWAMGPREVELAACGTWFAREPRGEGDELFPMLPTFTEPAELGDMLRWAVKHPRKRNEAAAAARAAVADRTFDNHAGQLLKLLDV